MHCATQRDPTFGHVPARADADASYAAEVERVFEIARRLVQFSASLVDLT